MSDIERAADAAADWLARRSEGDAAGIERLRALVRERVAQRLQEGESTYLSIDYGRKIDDETIDGVTMPDICGMRVTTRSLRVDRRHAAVERLAIDPAEAVPVTVQHVFLVEDIENLITTAFEGGINYWVRRADRRPAAPDFACTLRTIDGEDRALDLEKIVAGLRLVATQWPKHFGDFLDESGDATTADVIIQAAVFGELVYG